NNSAVHGIFETNMVFRSGELTGATVICQLELYAQADWIIGTTGEAHRCGLNILSFVQFLSPTRSR
ncbi:MAG: hypothetical protein DRR11_11420, partial [Gammaproteobacteria bacterium]